jgi:hypothetical protein
MLLMAKFQENMVRFIMDRDAKVLKVTYKINVVVAEFDVTDVSRAAVMKSIIVAKKWWLEEVYKSLKSNLEYKIKSPFITFNDMKHGGINA